MELNNQDLQDRVKVRAVVQMLNAGDHVIVDMANEQRSWTESGVLYSPGYVNNPMLSLGSIIRFGNGEPSDLIQGIRVIKRAPRPEPFFINEAAMHQFYKHIRHPNNEARLAIKTAVKDFVNTPASWSPTDDMWEDLVDLILERFSNALEIPK